MRKAQSLPELMLWRLLKGDALGVRFRRQHPVGPYILDFFCTARRLAVEVDGLGHEARVEHDARRDAWLAGQGIRVLRFAAADVLDEDAREGVMLAIRAAVEEPSSP